MTSRTTRVWADAVAWPRVRSRRLHAVLLRFDARVRPAIGALADAHPYYEDLAVSFPGALHAIAFGRNRGEARAEAAAQLVRAGAPLKSVARTLGMPMWLRQLPPEAFVGPTARLPDGPLFVSQIANHLPKSARHASRWLAVVETAYAAADEQFAIWAAREFGSFRRDNWEAGLRLLGLFAWSSQRQDTAAGRLVKDKWTPALSLVEAGRDAIAWLHAVEFRLYEADRRRSSLSSLGSMELGDIALSLLDSPEAIEQEGRAMGHCIASYMGEVARGCLMVWSVKVNDEHVATLAMRKRWRNSGLPCIHDLRGKFNADAPESYWRIIYRILAEWPGTATAHVRCSGSLSADRDAWIELWKPYWIEKGRPPETALDPRNQPPTHVWEGDVRRAIDGFID